MKRHPDGTVEGTPEEIREYERTQPAQRPPERPRMPSEICQCGKTKWFDAAACEDCWDRNYYWEPPR